MRVLETRCRPPSLYLRFRECYRDVDAKELKRRNVYDYYVRARDDAERRYVMTFAERR